MDRMDWTGFWRMVERGAHVNAGVTVLTGGSWLAYAVNTVVWTAVGIALAFALAGLLNLLDELRDRLDELRAGRLDPDASD